MVWDHWVIDASLERPDDVTHAFTPVELDESGKVTSIVTGMVYGSKNPPDNGFFYGVWHPDGQEAAQKWVDANRKEFERLLTFRQESKPA